MDRLPGDLEQNFATIAPYTIEEAYEVADAIARSDFEDLKDELGDLLLQVADHARMAEEQGSFDFGDVVEAITKKMIRRHPHVFAKCFPGIVGTSIVSIFGAGFATTGFSMAQARREGFAPVCARIEAQARPRYFDGTKTMVELVADRGTGRLIGGSVIGEEGAAGRINVIAVALECGMRVEDFEQLDLAYSPPFSTVWDPLLIAAQRLRKELS